MAVPAPPHQAGDHFRSQMPTAQMVPTTVAVVVISAAAVILDPAIGDTPLIASESRGYFAICIVAGIGLFLSRAIRSTTERDLPSDAAYAFLVTAAPALFLVGRIRAFWILFFLILAVGIALVDSDSFRKQFGLPVSTRWAAMVLLVWLLIAGITSFQLENRLAMPVAAAAAWSGAALLLPPVSTTRVGGLTLLAAIAVVGAEIKLALNFVRIDPLLSATIWLMGIGISFAAIVIMRMRATS